MHEEPDQPFMDENVLLPTKDLDLHDLLAPANPGSSQLDQIELLEKLAFFDQLTGLYNAHTFLRELKEEVARAQRYQRPLSICVLSIDRFEEIKEQYGPIGCEMLLKYTAGLLRSLLREVDIASRVQAEQFAIILPETNNAGALVVAERIRQRMINQPVNLTFQTVSVSASVGLAAFPKHGQNVEDLINNAFAALSKAMAEGGNKIAAP